MYQPINYDLLKSKGACVEQLELFKEHFGVEKSIPLTEEVACKFRSLFDVNWAAYNLLTREDKAEYEKVRDPAFAEYMKVCAQAYAEYMKVCTQAYAEYMKVCDQAYAEYEKYMKVRDPARVEYEKVRDPARVEYEKVCAVEFVRIYKRGLTSK